MLILILINNPTATIGIFSVVQKIANAFLRQIKTELEENEVLIGLYDNVFWPSKKIASRDAFIWSVTEGITVKRKGAGFKDPTVFAQGLVDGTATGRRLSHAFFDDVVNDSSIGTEGMLKKTNDALAMVQGTFNPNTERYYAGTFYGSGDPHTWLAEHGVPVNIVPCYGLK